MCCRASDIADQAPPAAAASTAPYVHAKTIESATSGNSTNQPRPSGTAIRSNRCTANFQAPLRSWTIAAKKPAIAKNSGIRKIWIDVVATHTTLLERASFQSQGPPP